MKTNILLKLQNLQWLLGKVVFAQHDNGVSCFGLAFHTAGERYFKTTRMYNKNTADMKKKGQDVGKLLASLQFKQVILL